MKVPCLNGRNSGLPHELLDVACAERVARKALGIRRHVAVGLRGRGLYAALECQCTAAGFADSSIPSAFITASVVRSVGLPSALNER